MKSIYGEVAVCEARSYLRLALGQFSDVILASCIAIGVGGCLSTGFTVDDVVF